MPRGRPCADEIVFIGQGESPGGPWVLETWHDIEWRFVSVRHPEWPPGYGGGRGFGKGSSALSGGWVTFHGPTSDTKRSLIVGAIQAPVEGVRFESEAGASTEAVVLPIPDDNQYRAFVVPLEDPPTGSVVGLDASGAEVDRRPSRGVEAFRAETRPLIEAKRRALRERRAQESG